MEPYVVNWVVAAVAITAMYVMSRLFLRRLLVSDRAIKQFMGGLEATVAVIRGVPAFRQSIKKRDTIASGGPKSFYSLEEHQVRELYAQIAPEPEPKRVETREAGSTASGVTANLKIAEPKYEKKRSAETVRTYEPDLSLGVMYNRVERYLLDTGDVTFGLEDFDYDDAPIVEFRSMCEKMENESHFVVPLELRDKYVAEKMRTSAQEWLKYLSAAKGYVAMQAEFTAKEASAESLILSLDHPVSQYLWPEDGKASISILCSKENLTSTGAAVLSDGQSVTATVFGRVVRWNATSGDLAVRPIAIY